MAIPLKTKKMRKEVGIVLTSMNIHYAFHCVSMILYAGVIYAIKHEDNPFIEFNALLRDLSYLFITRQYYIYLLVKSTRYNNIYLFYMGIVLLGEKCLVLIFTSSEDSLTKLKLQHYMIVALTICNLLEFVFILARTYSIRNDIKFILLKQVGSSPEINRAFVTRALLNALGNVSLFLMVHITLQDMLYLNGPIGLVEYLSIFGLLLEIFVLIIAFADLDAENSMQRIISVWLAGIKSLYMIGFAVARITTDEERGAHQTYYKIFTYEKVLDIAIVSCIMTYALYRDYTQLGSGLKEFYLGRPARIAVDG